MKSISFKNNTEQHQEYGTNKMICIAAKLFLTERSSNAMIPKQCSGTKHNNLHYMGQNI